MRYRRKRSSEIKKTESSSVRVGDREPSCFDLALRWGPCQQAANQRRVVGTNHPLLPLVIREVLTSKVTGLYMPRYSS